MITTIVTEKTTSLAIGKELENGARRFLFPFETTATTAVLLHKRAQDEHPYAVTASTVTEGGIKYLEWVVSSTDVGMPGRGMAEVTYSKNSTVIKTVTYATVTERSLDDGERTVPTASATWVNTVNTKTSQAVTARNEAVAARNTAVAAAQNNHLHGLFHTVEEYGAEGDGETDDTAAINAALAAGGTIAFSGNKTYCISGILRITQSGTVVQGNGATILAAVSSGPIMAAYGTAGEEQDIYADVTATDGDTSTTAIRYKNAAGFSLSTGDAIVIQSQRAATHWDSGLYWCGTPTQNAAYIHWAEPLLVNNVTDVATITENGSDVTIKQAACTGTLLYPYYLANKNSADTCSGARAHSTVRKVSFLKDVAVENLRFECAGGNGTGTSNTIFFAFCRDSVIRDVSVRKSGTNVRGRCFALRNCWNCAIEDCVADAGGVYTPGRFNASELNDNHITINSSWYCRISGCKSYHAGQSFDISYGSFYTETGWKSIACPTVCTVIDGCTVHGSASSAATNHSGAWGITYTNNTFINCARAVALRSPHTVFMNNKIIAHSQREDIPYNEGYAISIAEPTIFQTVIAGNSIIGSKGIYIAPAVNRDDMAGFLAIPELSVLGVEIYGNLFQNTHGAFRVLRKSSWGQTTDMGVNIHHNVIRGSHDDPVLCFEGGNCNGVVMEQNTLIACTSTANRVTYKLKDSSDTTVPVVRNNKLVLCTPNA